MIFRAMGIARLYGREFNSTDVKESEPVTIINETMGRRFWPGQNPIGKQFAKFEDKQLERITVIGVVADLKRSSLDQKTVPEAYLPHSQASWASDMYFALRTTGDPMSLVPALRRAVLDVDPVLPLIRVSSLAQMVSSSVTEPRFRTAVFASLALVAGALALVGVYGILSFIVADARREMAIRMALGARHRRLQSDVIVRALKLSAAGGLVGILGAVAETRALQGFLFGVTFLDPVTFALMPAGLLIASLVAAWAPARRAIKVDPVQVLKQN